MENKQEVNSIVILTQFQTHGMLKLNIVWSCIHDVVCRVPAWAGSPQKKGSHIVMGVGAFP